MNNWQISVDATNTAYTSQGSALRENAEYLKSFEARINQLKNGFTEFSTAMGNAFLEGGMLAVIDGLTKLAEVSTKVVNEVGALPIVLGAVGLALAGMGALKNIPVLGQINTFATNAGKNATSLTFFANSFERLKMTMGNFQTGGFSNAFSNMGVVQRFKNDIGTLKEGASTYKQEIQKLRDSQNGFVSASDKARIATQTLGTTFATTAGRTGVLITGIRAVGVALATTIRTVISSTVIGAVFVGIGIGIEKLIGWYQKKKKAEEEMIKTQDKMVEGYRKSGDGMQYLVDTYEKLDAKNGKLNDKEQTEYLRITKALADTLPNVVDHIDSEGRAHLRSVDAIKREVEAAKQLSEAKANATKSNYAKNMDKQTETINKQIVDLKKLREERDKLQQEQDNFNEFGKGYTKRGGWEEDFTDKSSDLAEKNLEVLRMQEKLRTSLQDTTSVVQKQTMAYLEAEGQLANMTDAQQKVIELFQQAGQDLAYEKYLDPKLTQEQAQKAGDAVFNNLYKTGQEIGKVFSDAYKSLSSNIDSSTQDGRDKLQGIKTDLDAIAKSLPKDMFKIENMGDIDEFKDKLEAIIKINQQVKDGSGDWDNLVKSLQDAGFSSKEAGQTINNLANQYNNVKLKADAASQGIEDNTAALEENNQKMIEAIDLSSSLFGYSGSELGAMESHIKNMHLLVAAQGEGAKATDAYKESVQALTEFLDITPEQLESNIGGYMKVIQAMKELDPLTYEITESYEEFINKQENLDESTKQLLISLGKTSGIKDTITGATKNVTQATEEQKTKTEELANVQEKTAEKLSIQEQKQKDLVQSITTTNTKIDEQKTKTEGLTSSQGQTSEKLSIQEQKQKDLAESITATNTKIEEQKTKTDKLYGTQYNSALATEYQERKQRDLAGTIDAIAGTMENSTSKYQHQISKMQELAGASDATNAKLGDQITMAQQVANAKTQEAQAIAQAANASNSNASAKTNEATQSFVSMQASNENANAKRAEAQAIVQTNATISSMGNAYSQMAENAQSSANQVRDAIIGQQNSMANLAMLTMDVVNSIRTDFNLMSSTVSSNTSSMIGVHNNQTSALDRVKQAANEAKTAVQNLNSTITGAMSSLSSYIQKAQSASNVKVSTPRLPSLPSGASYNYSPSQRVGGAQYASLNSNMGVSASVQSLNASITSALSGVFSASSGESSGESGGMAGGGTSGILRPSIYEGGLNSLGQYTFTSSALDKATPFYSIDRQMSELDIPIASVNKRMEGLKKGSAEYLKLMREAFELETKRWKLVNKDLYQTREQNKLIMKRLEQLKNTGKHTEAQREEYNELWSTYESNLDKIKSLTEEWYDYMNTVNERYQDMLIAQVEGMVEKYTKTIDKFKDKSDDIEFKIRIAEITNPDNLERLTDLYAAQAANSAKEQVELEKQKAELEKKLAESNKKFGSDSKASNEIRAQIAEIEEAWEDATLAILESEQKIEDIRANVADQSIDQLKDYYGKMKEMAVNAIEEEKEALQKASEEKQKMYDKEIDKINEVYDTKMQTMDRENDESDYQAELEEKNAKRIELVNKIALLSRDNSTEGKKRLEEMKAELAEQEKEIAKFQQDRQRELEKQALEDQKQSQIDAVNVQKEEEQKKTDEQLAYLDKQKDYQENKYDNILNNEEYWANLREDFINGDFSGINDEIANMQSKLDMLSAGNLEVLGKGFSSFSKGVKADIEEFNNAIINSALFNLSDLQGSLDSINKTDYKPIKDVLNKNAKSTSKASAKTQKGLDKSIVLESNKIGLNEDSRNKSVKSSTEKIMDGVKGVVSKVTSTKMKDIIDVSKVADKVKSIVPNITTKNIASQLATNAATNITNNYELIVNIDKLNGDKNGANTVVKEIMNGLKKLGK